MRMARMNIYVPDELAQRAKSARLNVSTLTQAALRQELAAHDTSEWLAGIAQLPLDELPHQWVLEALDESGEESEEDWAIR